MSEPRRKAVEDFDVIRKHLERIRAEKQKELERPAEDDPVIGFKPDDPNPLLFSLPYCWV